MSEQRDISEVQAGDKVVDECGFVTDVLSVDDDVIIIQGTRCPRDYWRECGTMKLCGSDSRYHRNYYYIRPASSDDIARYEKKQLVDRFNSTKFSEFSTEKLQQLADVMDGKGVVRDIRLECAKWADDLSENGVLTRSQLRDKLMDFAAAIREGGDA